MPSRSWPLTKGVAQSALAVGTLLLAQATPANAHHSAAPHFYVEQTISVSGVVTRFAFVNPHSYVYFEVKGPEGRPVTWRCELPARAALARLGWTIDVFQPGHSITVKGAPARREDNVCMLTSFIREDGVEIAREQDLTRRAPAAAGLVTSAASPARLARLANGRPNLNGPWVAQFGPGRGRPGGPRGGRPGGPDGPGRGAGAGPPPGGRGRGGPDGPPGRLELTAEGERASARYDQRFDDPAIKCSPANIIFGWTHDQHVNEIVQGDNEIVLKYGYMDFVRTIHMNAAHPKTIVPSLGGHSTGTWDGDVLVVDTVGFAPGVAIPIAGLMHSDRMHVIERFTLDPNANTLTRAYRAEDPLYFKTPYTGTDVMLLSTEPFVPYNCVELSGKNNIRPK